MAEQLYVRLLTLDDHPYYQGCDLDAAQEVHSASQMTSSVFSDESVKYL